MAKRQQPPSSSPDSSYFTRLGMEVELQRLEAKTAQLRAWLGRVPEKVKGTSPRRKGTRTMSADARRRISEAQKARWAKQRGQAAAAESAATTPKAKRGRPAKATKTGRTRGMKARHEM